MIFRPNARHMLMAGFALTALSTSVLPRPASADDTMAACDEAAGARFDSDRPASVTPVELAKIDTAKAEAACQASVVANPTDKRQLYELGRVYLAQKNYPKALETLKKAADMGSAMATSDYGVMLDHGIGTAKDPAGARALFEKAAATGNAEATYNLAVANQLGTGGAKDFIKARALYDKAAAAGVSKAYFRLGYVSELGIGGPADVQKARSAYMSCANDPTAGSSQAICQRRLGFLYETGKLGRVDPVTAKQLFEKSAAAGDVDATRALGEVYEEGKGVRIDYQKARDYFEKAAAKGDPDSMARLSTMYERGWGVPRDMAQSKAWIEKSKSAADTAKALKFANEPD